ncbi:glycosyltransferase [Pedobacter hiemivivus]|uniref:Glycosyltransferase n=1 Tax=Pedobacter hiemivivus TaxID=2530454 RepID=A0A4V5PCJ8_9SPHI|nr:glycosyltransferase family 4 protein [Pedobacter hiemivivus]TKC56876.1 glycosyltransferase [Pedobacter hiemivivus]
MKVTLINTSDSGGGAPAASLRLLKALASENVDAGFLVQTKKTTGANVKAVQKSFFDRLRAKINFLYERLPFIFFYERDKSVRFAFSTANAGASIVNDPMILDADILHLHWVNSGFLSIANLKELVKLGKPMVVTLHDMWYFTGGCHYAGTCDHFIRQCGDCYFLKKPAVADISHEGWLRKEDLYAYANNITFVTCSNWLEGVARQSALLKKFQIRTIPNPIDIDVYSPRDKRKARLKWNINPEAKIILFGAANISDRRKGIDYLFEGLQYLRDQYPESAAVEVVIFGKNKQFDVTKLPFPVYELNVITAQQDLAEIYGLADVFVLPSIEDNLPNTAMESLSCGTPVVAFNTGGLPDLIDHQQNGYLADFKSASDLAKGMYEMLYSARSEEISSNARAKVLNTFTNKKVAQQYIEVYQSILKK